MGYEDDKGHGTTGHAPQSLPPDALPVAPLEVVLERQTLHSAAYHSAVAPQILEIFTQNRVYVVDANLICAIVLNRTTGMPERNHAALGARLLGGQRRYGKTIHVSKPFPIPGTEAVFESTAGAGRRPRNSVTSKVERVVLHVHLSSLVIEDEGAWEEVTSTLLRPVRHPG